MEYKRLGVAFCVEMFREAEILCSVLGRFFDVIPVCCRIGSTLKEDAARGEGTHSVVCNAIGQAQVLNHGHTDLNLIVGLCVGCDILFTEHSAAPVTTLFVKDKSLANNPVGALYSRYYLDDLIEESALDRKKGVL